MRPLIFTVALQYSKKYPDDAKQEVKRSSLDHSTIWFEDHYGVRKVLLVFCSLCMS